jgi:hypothetical protein
VLEFLTLCALSVMFLSVWHAADPGSRVAENGLAIIGVAVFLAVAARMVGWW